MDAMIHELTEVGAVLNGHFLLSSGLHSGTYCQCAKLFEHPDAAARVVAHVTEQLKDTDFDVIVGPAMGGVIAAYELSRQTGKPNIFTERVDHVMCLRRGFELSPGQRVLIMEDVITTGKSTLEVAEVLRAHGAEVAGAACIVDRCNIELPFTLVSAVKLDIEAYQPGDCPLCGQMPLVKPGSRRFV